MWLLETVSHSKLRKKRRWPSRKSKTRSRFPSSLICNSILIQKALLPTLGASFISVKIRIKMGKVSLPCIIQRTFKLFKIKIFWHLLKERFRIRRPNFWKTQKYKYAIPSTHAENSVRSLETISTLTHGPVFEYRREKRQTGIMCSKHSWAELRPQDGERTQTGPGVSAKIRR